MRWSLSPAISGNRRCSESCCRSRPDDELYLFPRLVAQGNYSRIGIARVRFNEAGDPMGVERLGIALEPADYELGTGGKGGVRTPYHIRRTAPALYHGLYSVFTKRTTNRPSSLNEIFSTGNVSASQRRLVPQYRCRECG